MCVFIRKEKGWGDAGGGVGVLEEAGLGELLSLGAAMRSLGSSLNIEP